MSGEGFCRIERSLSKVARFGYIGKVALAVLASATSLIGISVLCLGIASQVAAPFDTTVQTSTLGLLSLFLLWFCMAFALWVAYFIFKDMSLKISPFTKKHANRLKLLGAILLASTALQTLLSPETLAILDIGDIAIGASMREANEYQGIPINIGLLTFGLFCICFSLVFEYGALLQKLSDETV